MKIRILILFILFPFLLFASVKIENFDFAVRDTLTLSLDVYYPEVKSDTTACLIYVYGGGFFAGSKDQEYNVRFCKAMSDSGFVVAAIDYRLGMKGVNKRGLSAVKPLVRSINMATEDLFAASAFLYKNAGKIGFDKSRMVLVGSSAGAIASLQADYELSNSFERVGILPSDFRYAAVIAFAGGIYSEEGKPDYKKQPAPTMFFHGMDDKIVKYDFMQAIRRGFFGTKALTNVFESKGYQYVTWRFKNIGHEMSYLPMEYYKKEITWFVRDVVYLKRNYSMDVTVSNHNLPKAEFGSWSVRKLYKRKF